MFLNKKGGGLEFTIFWVWMPKYCNENVLQICIEFLK